MGSVGKCEMDFNPNNPINHGSDKAHGGEIKVEAKEGEGAEFIIQLPPKDKL